jgi:hypothetical protein
LAISITKYLIERRVSERKKGFGNVCRIRSAQIVVGAVKVQKADDILVADLRPNLDLVFAFNRGSLTSKDESKKGGRMQARPSQKLL